MAALSGLLHESTRFYPHIEPSDVRMILAHSHDRLLPELGPRLAAYAQRQLAQRGVEIRLNTRVTGAGEGWVTLGEERIDTHLLIWTAGVAPTPAIGDLGACLGRHKGLVVDSCLRVPGHPGVWALGDCDEIPRRSNGTDATTAQNATHEGRLAARNIVATLRGKAPTPFVHRPLGQLALVGRRAGVAELLGLRFSGFIAWFLWRAIYLAKLPGVGNRARVSLDWLLDLAFGRQLIVPPATVPRQGSEHSSQ
jgi:NADH dehydrogenase